MKKKTTDFNQVFKQLTLTMLCFAWLYPLAAQDCTPETPCSALSQPCGPELVKNGHFDDGFAHFDSDYPRYGQNGTTIGDCPAYTLVPNAYAFYSHWKTRFDHTCGNDGDDTKGLFFIGDAQCTPTIVTAWRQTINLQAGQSYAYGAWVSNLDDDSYQNKAVFIFTDALGTQVVNEHTVQSLDESVLERWEPVCGQYTATISGPTTMEIRIIPSTENPTLMGADFGLDDITLRALSPGDPNFTYSPEEPCIGQPVLFSSDPLNTGTHQWTFQNGNPSTSSSPNPVVTFTTSGPQEVTHTLTSANNGCSVNSVESIYIAEDCDDTDCGLLDQSCGRNLVDNGQFDDANGAEQYIVGLVHRSDLPGATFGDCGGAFVIDNESSIYAQEDNNKSNWDVDNDHSNVADGNFLIVDAPCINDGVTLWQQEVTLVRGTSFKFSTWAANLYNSSNGGNDDNLPFISLLMNGERITAPQEINYEDGWVEVCGVLSIPAAGNEQINVPIDVTLSIYLEVSSDNSLGGDIGLDDIQVFATGVLDASFVVVDEEVCAGSEITFSATDQTVNTSHFWDFGNGNNGSGSIVTTTFPLDETYTITHTVINNTTGCENFETLPLKVENCCEVEAFWIPTVNDDLEDCTVFFDDQSSAANVETGQIDSWYWEFADFDGTVHGTSTDSDTEFEFPDGGEYWVCLTVTGSTGEVTCTDVYCDEVNPNCNVCSVMANMCWVEVERDPILQTVTLDFEDNSDFSDGTQGVTYSWTFIGVGPNNSGNGNNIEANQKNPLPLEFFEAQETITVILTVNAQNGILSCSDTYCYEIDLADPENSFRPCPGYPDDRSPFKNMLVNQSKANIINPIIARPNPFNESLTIDLEFSSVADLEIEIIDFSGKTVVRHGVQGINEGKHSFELDTDKLPKGMYIVQVKKEGQTTRMSLIK